jgi:hypothetical protein
VIVFYTETEKNCVRTIGSEEGAAYNRLSRSGPWRRPKNLFRKRAGLLYPDRIFHDVWTPLETVRQRQRALIALGFNLGRTGADGDWGRLNGTALRLFQRHHGMVIDGLWSTFVSRKVHAVLAESGRDLRQVTAGRL